VADSPPQPTTVRRGESALSKPSRRPTREARKQHKQKRRAAQRELRAHRAAEGRLPPRAGGYRTGYVLTRVRPKNRRRSIRRSGAVGGVSDIVTETVEGVEQDPGSPAAEEGQSQADGSVALWGAQLRTPSGLRCACLLPLREGESICVQMASRREANRELSGPAFLATLQALFPELESLPHADTLAVAVAGDRGPGLGRDAYGVAAGLDPQQEIPSLLDQPVLPDCHRWDAEVE
jgi:hypothetical protein